jgi:hypothetical protein
MEKLFLLLAKMSIPRIPVPLDKQAHFMSGALGSLSLAIFIGYWAIVVIALIALAKEVYDAHNIGHTCDFYDWLATTLGGILGAGLWQLISHL